MLAVYPHAPNVACLPIAFRCSWYHKGIGVVPGGHRVQMGVILVYITDSFVAQCEINAVVSKLCMHCNTLLL